MRDPLLTVARQRNITPQITPIPGRTDQVENSAGGYVFAVDDWTRLHRFLVLGTEGGTFYVGEHELTRDNAAIVFKLIDLDGPRVVSHVVQLSEAGDTPKQNTLLFTLAAAASVGDDKTRAAALAALPRVARTGTHLFQWNAYAEGMRGWGRARARAVASWYTDKPVEKVAYQAVKYRQRDGWTHRDMLRLSHPKTAEPARVALFDFICGRIPTGGLLPLVDAYREAQSEGLSVSRAVELVEVGLPWEALPNRLLNEPTIWDALLGNLGATAMLRQLPRLTRLGLLKPLASIDRIAKLADPEFLRSGRIHPVAVLNALFGYRSGISRGGQTWTPVPKVIDLLDDAFHASFGAITPANKRTLVALDVSGSMTWTNLASLPALTAADASAAMAMATVRTEPECLVTAFAGGGLEMLPITDRHRLDDVRNIMAQSSQRFGRTDCALPMVGAQQNKLDVDTFVIYTDNETYAGTIHPTQALKQYRQTSGIEARSAVVAMTSTGFTIADPTDAGQLDLVGFDAAAPHLLSEFSRGNL
jgi:60 kDa SS-A/Ro ribonucleoprotein